MHWPTSTSRLCTVAACAPTTSKRANREIKRRSRVVQVFPSAESLIRLIGAVCTEVDEDWSSRCYIAPESLAKLEENTAIPEPAITDEIRKRAARLVAVAMELVQSERRTA